MKAALIGLGSMGKNHYNAAQDSENVELVAAVDCDKNNLKNINCSAYTDVDEMLSKEDVDFVIVATPTSTHSKIAKKILCSGKHLFIEKPIAYNAIEAQEIVQLALENNCKGAVGHIERFNPAMQAVLPSLEGEEIIHCSASRVSPFPKRIADVGVKMDLGIHDMDLLNLIMQTQSGAVKSCRSVQNNTVHDQEDTSLYMIKYSNGATASILSSWMMPFQERMIKIIAKSCYYEIDLLNLKVNRFRHLENKSYVVEPMFVRREDALRKQLNSFANYIKTDKIGYLCSLQDGLTALHHITQGD